MEVIIRISPCIARRFGTKLRFVDVVFEIVFILLWLVAANSKLQEHQPQSRDPGRGSESIVSHSCIHDQILEQRKQPGWKVYSITPQVYEKSSKSKPLHGKGRTLFGISNLQEQPRDAKQPIRIYLNYDAVGHSPARDCQRVGDILKLGEPPATSLQGNPSCNPHVDPPVYGDCWYHCIWMIYLMRTKGIAFARL